MATSRQEFRKYGRQGAYHWRHLSKKPWRHQAYTAARYRMVLRASGARAGMRVVDFGCGDGALTYLLSRSGASCVGIEPDDVGRELARSQLSSRGVDALFVSAAKELDPRSADIVVCSEVIEHVPEPHALLAEIRDVLKDGGKLVLTTPVRTTEVPFDDEHVHEFFPNELADVVRGAGFVIDRHDLELPAFGVGLIYWRPWFLLRLPVTKWTINILSAWFGYDVLAKLRSISRYHTLQLIEARPQR